MIADDDYLTQEDLDFLDSPTIKIVFGINNKISYFESDKISDYLIKLRKQMTKMDDRFEYVEYKGKKYPLLSLCIKHKEIYPKGQWVRVAQESFAEILQDKDGDYTEPEAIKIDELIYHYVEDDVFNTADKRRIAENELDEKFEYVDDVEE